MSLSSPAMTLMPIPLSLTLSLSLTLTLTWTWTWQLPGRFLLRRRHVPIPHRRTRFGALLTRMVVLTTIRIRATRSSALDLDFVVVGLWRVSPVTVVHAFLLRPLVDHRATWTIMTTTRRRARSLIRWRVLWVLQVRRGPTWVPTTVHRWGRCALQLRIRGVAARGRRAVAGMVPVKTLTLLRGHVLGTMTIVLDTRLFLLDRGGSAMSFIILSMVSTPHISGSWTAWSMSVRWLLHLLLRRVVRVMTVSMDGVTVGG